MAEVSQIRCNVLWPRYPRESVERWAKQRARTHPQPEAVAHVAHPQPASPARRRGPQHLLAGGSGVGEAGGVGCVEANEPADVGLVDVELQDLPGKLTREFMSVLVMSRGGGRGPRRRRAAGSAGEATRTCQ